MMQNQRALEDILARCYSFQAIASQDGGWVIWFPDLPGCMTQADTWAEIGAMAEEAVTLWLTDRLEQGLPIPEPSVGGATTIRWPTPAGTER